MAKYTNSQRRKIYKVKSKIRPTVSTSIPKGKSKSAIEKRKEIITQTMPKYFGVYHCPALRADVAINSNISLHKARSASANSQKSTILLTMIREIIANAQLIYTDKPKTNKGQKMFSEILVLVAAVRGIGWAKLTIGKYNDNAARTQAPYCEYCIQHLSIHSLKNK